MEQEGKFLQSLEELKNIAATQHDTLTLQDIRQYFSDFAADDTKMELIYNYFVSNHIKIVGREQQIELEEQEDEFSELDDKEKRVLDLYMEEIGEVKQLDEREERDAVKKMVAGDEMAKMSLIESKLKLVAQVAGEYKNKGLPLGDLIQEGNIGLLQCVEHYEEDESMTFHEFAKKAIEDAIKKAVQSQTDSEKTSQKIASKVNELDEATMDLAKQLDREATPQELAQYMHISEEEVRDLMKMSLDAISVIEPNIKVQK